MRGTRHIQRSLKQWKNRVFDRLTHDDLTRGFRRLGLQAGSTVCVHASLSRLGYVEGGPDGFVDAILQTVGSNGRVLMPTFPMAGSMLDRLQSGVPFDVSRSPSKVGAVTEAFRRRVDVIRSVHPTNPLCGWGRDVESLLRDHDRSPTPYGHDTPYGRLAGRDDSFILMVETHVHSLLHHLQERVDFPNLFLPDEMEAVMIDANGSTRRMRTRVMRPRIPYFVAIPSCGSPPDWAILHDFALIFPERRQRIVRELGYRFEGYPGLFERRESLENAGVLRTTKIGTGEVGLLHVRDFLNRIEPEFRELIERFRPHYELGKLEALNLPYV